MAVATLALLAGCARETADVGNEEAQPRSSLTASAAGGGEPVTFFAGTPLDLSSPDRRYRLVSVPTEGGLTQLIAIRASDGGRQLVGSYEPPTAVLWSPSSEAFFVNDQRGSGQSSYLEVVRLEQGRFRRDVAARTNLNRLYNRLFECDLSDDFINTSGEKWSDASTLVVGVQANQHSDGCRLDPFSTNRLLLLVNARTGEVLHRRAAHQ